MKLLIGCGKMGSAILEGWLQNEIKDVIVLARTKDRAKEIESKYKIKTILSISELEEKTEIILCAVKPYQVEEVLPACEKFDSSIFISVVVGKSIQYIKNLIGDQHRVVRAMPNITCLAKQGVIGAYADNNQHKNIDDVLSTVDNLLSTIGKVFWLKNENEIEITAALPGGLPAFLMKILSIYAEEVAKFSDSTVTQIKSKILKLFSEKEKLPIIDHILNGWISDATLLGLDNNMAIEMALRTVVGTIELLKSMPLDDIITAVASKEGTTEAGLFAIERGLSPVTAAYRRAVEIN